MNIKEVCEKASHKDLLECEILGDKQEFILWFNQILTRDKKLPVFIYDHFKTNTWQIIPAKKEPMNFDEWRISEPKHRYVPALLGTDLYDSKEHEKEQKDAQLMAWQASEKNHDLLYTELIARVNEFINAVVPNLMIPKGIEKWQSYFQMALERFKQHKEQDGNK